MIDPQRRVMFFFIPRTGAAAREQLCAAAITAITAHNPQQHTRGDIFLTKSIERKTAITAEKTG